MTKQIILVPKETITKSATRDAISLVTCFAMAIPGWWIGSWVLEAVGFILFWVFILAKSAAVVTRYSPDEARAKIAEWEADQ